MTTPPRLRPAATGRRGEALTIALSTGDTAPAPGGDGLRERKKRQTFHAVQDAARRLVAERGLDRVTVEEIATAANVSKRTFFNYFDSKEAAVVDPEPGLPAALAALLAARPRTEEPLTSLRICVGAMLVTAAPSLRLIGELAQANPTIAHRHAVAFGRFEAVIVAWAADRVGARADTDTYPNLLGAVTNAVVNLAVMRGRPDTTGTFGDVIDEIFAHLGNGLAPPPPVPAALP